MRNRTNDVSSYLLVSAFEKLLTNTLWSLSGHTDRSASPGGIQGMTSIPKAIIQVGNDEVVFESADQSDNEISRTLLGSVYAFLSLALFANLAVVLTVTQILLARNQGAALNRATSFSSQSNAHILVYILALSVVDSLVLINAAVVSTTIFLQRWIFYRALCTVYYAIDSVNKTLSTFILTCLSLDRLLAVRYPQRRLRIRSIRGTCVVLALCFSFAFVLLLPVYVNTDIIQVSIVDEHGNNETTPTCAFVGETDFAVALAVFGFLVPLILMSVFYMCMLTFLNKRRKRLVTSQERSSATDTSALRRSGSISTAPTTRLKAVTTRTLLLVLFHFGCWTPYWLGSFYVMMYESELGTTGVIIMYVIHVGTYLNSAVNPILYALLNRDLRQRRRNTIRRREKRRRAVVSLGIESVK